MSRFYINTFLEVGLTLNLPQHIVNHIKALRLKSDSLITLFNNSAHSYLANIQISKRDIIATILQDQGLNKFSLIPLTLAVGIIANDKMDLIIQKATELGVTTIIPIISQFSQRIDKNKLSKKYEHWQAIAISSCEQSGRNTLPEIKLPANFMDFVQNNKDNHKILLTINNKDKQTIKKANNYTILVGPEGGFSNFEEKLAIENNFLALNLGFNVLRSETAAIAGASIIQYLASC